MTSAADVMQAIAEKFGVKLAISPLLISPLAIDVWADGDRIIQTITNLLSNAIKFSPQGATVWMKAKRGNGEWGVGKERHLIVTLSIYFLQSLHCPGSGTWYSIR